jgi:probable phosphoglycerate mutase
LKRAAQTAAIVTKYIDGDPGPDIRFRKELREQDFGIATGKSNAWFEEHRNERKPDEPLIYHRPIEGAETGTEVYERVAGFMKEIGGSDSEQIMLVAHGGSCQMVAAVWLGIPVTMLEHIAIIGNAGGVSVLTERSDGAHVMRQWNHRCF